MVATSASASTRAGAHEVEPEPVVKKFANVSSVVPT